MGSTVHPLSSKMEGPANIEEKDAVNKNKCYNCGKIFRAPAILQRHKNRKTPCLIREIPPGDAGNPNRCIYCNKIFSNKDNLKKHHTVCKIKNGGMDLLVDKVRYEQKIRILEEQNNARDEKDKQKDEIIQKLTEKLEEIDARTKQIVPANVVNNIEVVNTVNITINHYLKPELKYLFAEKLEDSLFIKIYRENLVMTPSELVPHIWFNKAHPENVSVFLVNKQSGDSLLHNGVVWRLGHRDTICRELRDRAYAITEGVLSKYLNKQMYVDPRILDNMERNRNDEEVALIEIAKISKHMLEGRSLIKRPVLA